MVSENAIWQQIFEFRDICAIIAIIGFFLIGILIIAELYLLNEED